MAIDEGELLECFLHLPASTGIPFVLEYKTISARQSGDARLILLRQQKHAQFAEQLLASSTKCSGRAHLGARVHMRL
jgi:hypothetical protein